MQLEIKGRDKPPSGGEGATVTKTIPAGSILLLASILVVLLSACGESVDPLSRGVAEGVAPTITIFHNGDVLTMDSEFTTAEAFAVDGNRIVAVGTEAEVLERAGAGSERVDLQGRTVVPGFIDAHLHTVSSTQLGLLEDVGLTRFSAVEEALSFMSERANEAQEGDWLLFNNLDFGTQSSKTDKLTAAMLDDVSSDLPVFVLHAGGHAASVNTRMLDLMGVDANTPDPEAGGNFGRGEDGSPDGTLYGFAALTAFDVIEPLRSFDVEAGLEEQSRVWLTGGLVTLGDAGVGALMPDELDRLQESAESGKLLQRVRGYLSQGLEAQWVELGIVPGFGDEKIRIVGYKLSADGSNQARTGLQRENYLGRDTKGIFYLDEEQLYQFIVDKSELGFQMAIHGNGDAAIDSILSAVARAREAGVEVIRPRIEHCSIVQDDQLARLKELDVSCSFLIGHVRLWGSAFRKTIFGQEKAEKLDRTGTFEREGIPYSLHSDAGVTTFTPLEMVEIAVTRELFAEEGYVLAPDERASREMALRGVSSTAAWQLMSDHEIGSLEAGKLADFVVLEDSPLEVEASEIGEIQVLETWIDGLRVYQRP